MSKTETSPIKITESSIDELRSICRDSKKNLYAILDACDEPRVPAKVHELGTDKAVSLYRGTAQQDYWAIAPYLAIVNEDLLNWIVESLWDDPWGIFTVSELSLQEVRKHFRRFLMVEDPDGNDLYFRLYDPRVFTSVIPSLTKPQTEDLFGGIDSVTCQLQPGKWCKLELVQR